MLLNSSANPLPNAILGKNLRLPNGSHQEPQLVDITLSYAAEGAIFELQNKNFPAIREAR
jgi:hypothetical protein